MMKLVGLLFCLSTSSGKQKSFYGRLQQLLKRQQIHK